ncbi:hypothetical protein [Deinococcus aquaticus]|uniref:hypothetical protein n=1 Tax=Deinococcus aquaticus TaxID=328692 RepID=UPI0036128B0D
MDRKAARLAKADAALSKLHPLEAGKHGAALRGWERLQAGDTHPEALELARRGLTPALASGLLTAYRWTGKAQGGKARPWPGTSCAARWPSRSRDRTGRPGQ